MKYLGILIGKNLNFSKHIQLIVNKTKTAEQLLITMLNSKSHLSIRNKLYIYKIYMRSTLTYTRFS